MMVLSETIVAMLNAQIVLEQGAHLFYTAAANWCNAQGFTGCEKYMWATASEETEHRNGFIEYLAGLDAQAIVPGSDAPVVGFASLEQVFEQAVQHEMEVTAHIRDIYLAALAEGDVLTMQLMNPYIEEQREGLIELFDIQRWFVTYGSQGAALERIDHKVGKLK